MNNYPTICYLCSKHLTIQHKIGTFLKLTCNESCQGTIKTDAPFCFTIDTILPINQQIDWYFMPLPYKNKWYSIFSYLSPNAKTTVSLYSLNKINIVSLPKFSTTTPGTLIQDAHMLLHRCLSLSSFI